MIKIVRALLIMCGAVMSIAPSALSAQTVSVGSADTIFYCPQLSITLQRGSRDSSTQGQVSELQSFLVDYYSLDEESTTSGYFGRLTHMYVQQFQREQGLPAAGIVGALTRTRIASVCATVAAAPTCPTYQQVRCNADEEYIAGTRDAKGCVSASWCKAKNITSDFYARPEEGYAPHAVTFYAMVGGRAQYAVDFGDGTGQQTIACVAPTDACVSPGKVEHVYSKVGAYTATLRRVYRIMELQPGDRILGPLASVTIRVKEKEVPVVKPDNRCKVWFDGCNTCTRAVSGEAFACTKMACIQGGAGQQPQPSCKEYFGLGKTDYPPAITGFSGPTQLEIQQDGLWRIEARDTEGQQLSYSVDWGEYLQGQAATVNTRVNFSQVAFVSHRFAQAGNYTVGITVHDTAGGSATSSTTVTVGNVVTACPSQSQVCGERRVCTAQECWNEKHTYSTICSLRAESAVLVSEGACTN